MIHTSKELLAFLLLVQQHVFFVVVFKLDFARF